MITLHSIVLRYSDRFRRWYGYTDSGVLIYFDFSFVSDQDKLISGHNYELMGKIQPPARHVDGGPAFTVVCISFNDLSVSSDPVSQEVPIL